MIMAVGRGCYHGLGRGDDNLGVQRGDEVADSAAEDMGGVGREV